jgi:hypothetical protein
VTTLYDELDGSYAEPWRATARDKIIGRIVRQAMIHGGHGSYPSVTLEVTQKSTEGGGKLIPLGDRRTVHALWSVLQRELAAIEPEIGQEIGIGYSGERTGSKASYRHYVVRRADANGSEEVNWTQYRALGGGDDRERPGASAPPTDEQPSSDPSSGW